VSIPRNVALKLDRATEHVQALQAAQEDFLAGKPYAYRRTIEGGTREGEGTSHVFRWERYTAPPHRVGLIAGDAVHNARSALDHLVVALAEQGARKLGITMTEKVEAGLQFPIVTSHDDFVKQVRRGRLEHIECTTRTVIEGHQPYRVSTDPARAQLVKLARLDNADKHRMIVPVGNAASVGGVMEIPGAKMEGPSDLPFPGERYGEPGTEIFRIVLDTPQREADVPCELHFGVVLAGIPPLIEMYAAIDSMVGVARTVAEDIAARCLPS
jgi:hypothetical protein